MGKEAEKRARRPFDVIGIRPLFGLFALDGTPADVLAVEDAVPVDAASQGIGPLLGFLHRVAEGGGAQHAATLGQAGVPFQAGACMEHLLPCHFVHRQAADGVVAAVVAGIATRRQHHADGGTGS